jgi:hypothetical protein
LEEREAAAYDEEAVRKAAENRGIPATAGGAASALRNWPIQLKLVPATASWLRGADILLCADCCAYAYGGLHADFLNGKKLLVGCPKLDEPDYREKLAAIFSANNIASLTILRMEVPCCAGIVRAAQEAAQMAAQKPFASGASGRVVVLSIEGRVLREESL